MIVDRISNWNDLGRYGVVYLTAESCALGLRVLCDVNAMGRDLVCRTFSILPAGLSESWNSGPDADPHVGSILLPRDSAEFLSIFALLNHCDVQECVVLYDRDRSWEASYGIARDTRPEELRDWHRFHESHMSYRRYAYQGTGGGKDRNRHEMSGRID